MNYTGLLGVRRLTNIPPLVTKEGIYKDKRIANQKQAQRIVIDVIEDNDLPFDDYSDDEFEQVIDQIVKDIYPKSTFSQSDRDAMRNCMKGKWAFRWTQGMEQATDTTTFTTDAGRLAFMLNGCDGMRNYIESTNEAFKPDNRAFTGEFTELDFTPESKSPFDK
jgi:hypothetical protein